MIVDEKEEISKKDKLQKVSKSLLQYSLNDIPSNIPYIQIYLDRCDNLPSMDRDGFSDPYVIFSIISEDDNVSSFKKIQEEHVKSTIVKKTLNPVWNGEHFYLAIPKENKLNKNLYLSLQVFDWDRLSADDFCGNALFGPLQKLPRNTLFQKTLQLVNSQTNATCTIRLMLSNYGLSKEEFEELEVEDLNLEPICINPLQSVLDKIQHSRYAGQFKTKQDEKQFANFLSSKQQLLSTYLNKDWIEVEENNVEVDVNSDEETKGSDSEDEEEQHVRRGSTINNNMSQLKGKVDVKLIIVDQDQDQKLKSTFRTFLSPVLSKLQNNSSMKSLTSKISKDESFIVDNSDKGCSSFGMFHSALIVGQWLIEWNDSGLCVPRKTLSKAALFCADLEPITTLQSLDQALEKLAEIIVEWNTTKKYKSMGGNKNIFGNCQDFCESVLQKIGIKFDYLNNEYMKDFFSDLKRKGSADLRFYCKSDQFITKFGLQEKLLSSTSGKNYIQFHTHEELDNFVNYLLGLDKHFRENYRTAWGFLKGIDRAFWLRYYKYNEMIDRRVKEIERAKKLQFEGYEKYLDNAQKELDEWITQRNQVKPITEETIDEEGEKQSIEKCPFSNPLQTYSLRIYQ
ncbi:hypothetical protein ABK040_005516 [Willaertia magna]